MRPEIRNPQLDPQRLEQATALAKQIYRCRESKLDFGDVLTSLAELAERSLTKSDVAMAYCSMEPEAWARDLLLFAQVPPSDLSDPELLELIGEIATGAGEDWQTAWWLACVAASTGGENVSDLIFWPKEALGPDDGRANLTPAEVLAEAKRRVRRILITPPPGSDSER